MVIIDEPYDASKPPMTEEQEKKMAEWWDKAKDDPRIMAGSITISDVSIDLSPLAQGATPEEIDAYNAIIRKLHEHIRVGTDESTDAEALKDQADSLWYRMNAEQRMAAGAFSESLYAESEDKPVNFTDTPLPEPITVNASLHYELPKGEFVTTEWEKPNA